MNDKKLEDQDNRIRAMTEFNQNLVVIAGAGTGKTSLLIGRLLHWLLGEAWRRTNTTGPEAAREIISSVAAVTFTEKAAAEISERLTRVLTELVSPAIPVSASNTDKFYSQVMDSVTNRYNLDAISIRKRALLLLEFIDRIEISTIHGFCAAILRNFTDEAGLNPGFTIDEDENDRKLLFDREWEKFAKSEFASNETTAHSWETLLRTGNLNDLKDFVYLLLMNDIFINPKDDKELQLLTGDPAVIKNQLSQELEKLIAQLNLLAESCKRVKTIKTALETLYAVSAALKNPEFLKKTDELNNDDSIINFLKSKAANIQELPDKKTVQENSDEEFLEELKKTTQKADILFSRILYLIRYKKNQEFWEAFFRIFYPFQKKVAERWRSEGLIGFRDLLIKTRGLLRKSVSVRKVLKSRFRQVLVDESQDTDPIQSEIITYLSEFSGDLAERSSDVRLEPGKLFVVGDPKQSIYGFRHADLGSFEWMQKKIDPSSNNILKLQTNFRSTDKIINTVNAIHDLRMKKQSGYQPEYIPIWSCGEESGEASELWLIVQRNEPDEINFKINKTDSYDQEARSISQYIKNEVDKNAGIKYGDFAVLLRAMTRAGGFMEAFENEDIPFVVEGDKEFYQKQEITDCINLLWVLLHPLDVVPFAGLLRSSLIGVPLHGMLYLSKINFLTQWWKPRKQDYFRQKLAESGTLWKKATSVASESLIELRRLFHSMPAHEWIDEIIKRFPLPEIYSGRYLGDRRAANVLKFISSARKAARNSDAGLFAWLRDQRLSHRQTKEEGEALLADENLDAVRILTIHKSKGLQFPVVLIPHLHSGHGAPGRTPFEIKYRWHPDRTNYSLRFNEFETIDFINHKKHEMLREETESIRLHYVACTRAEKKLILSGTAPSGLPKKQPLPPFPPVNNVLELVGDEIPQNNKREAAESLNLKFPFLRIKLIPFEEKQRIKKERKRSVPHQAPLKKYVEYWEKNYAFYEKASQSSVIVSPSQLQDRERELKDRKMEAEEEFVASVYSRTSRQEAMLIGTLCHEVMEKLDMTNPEADLERILKEEEPSLSESADIAAAERIISESRDIMLNFFQTECFKMLQKIDITGKEIPFLMPLQNETETRSSFHDPTACHGIIDLLYKKKDRYFIADYKTDKISGPGNLESLKQKYAYQKKYYAQAVKNALSLPYSPVFQLIFLRTGDIVEL